MWPFTKRYNYLGETKAQEIERRLNAAETSITQLKEDGNRLDSKWTLHESDITTLRRAILGIEEHPEIPPDQETIAGIHGD